MSGLDAWITTNTTADAPPLTAETFKAGWDTLIEMSDKAEREYGERARAVRDRGRLKSKLGQIVDSTYIRSGPMIMSPTAHTRFTEFLAEEERRAEAGEEQQLSDDAAMRISLAGWGY